MKHASARLALLSTCVGLVLAMAGSAAPAVPNGPSPDLVISQIYGGGGNSGATYSHDYIEIFNRGTASVSLEGKSLQYASAGGSGNFGANATQHTELRGSIPAVVADLIERAASEARTPAMASSRANHRPAASEVRTAGRFWVDRTGRRAGR